MPRRGFVLDGDGIVCIDLDHCLVDGVLVEWAAGLLEIVPRTYIEVSLSGDGLHVWGRGHVEQGRRFRDGRRVEVYGTGRYIAVTGVRFGGCPSTLGDLSGALAALLT